MQNLPLTDVFNIYSLQKKRPDSSKDLKIEEHIIFKKEVTNIQYFDDPNKNVIITCADNSTYEAKHVITTFPLGVLKQKHASLFSPKLPAIKVNSVEAILYGTMNKIFMVYDKPFWQEEWRGLGLVWTVEGLSELKKSGKHWW